MMELVGAAIAVMGVLLLMAIFTSTPPTRRSTTRPAWPGQPDGPAGRHCRPTCLQTFGLSICLVPWRDTWGVRMLRTHHLGFFGLRLSLLLLSLLMSAACVGLGDVGGAATHAGAAVWSRGADRPLPRIRAQPFQRRPHPDRAGLCRRSPSSHGARARMTVTDLPLIFRILRAPFIWWSG